MFESLGIWYEVVAGKHVNDYDTIGNYLSLNKAYRVASKLKDTYIRIDKYVGNFKLRDGDYCATIYEKTN